MHKRKILWSLSVIGLICVLGITQAKADTYTYVFTGAGLLSGTDFTLTTTAVIPTTFGLNDVSDETSATDLIEFGADQGAIQYIFLNGGSTALSFAASGLVIASSTAVGGASYTGMVAAGPGTYGTNGGTIVVTDITPAVPEPSALSLMLIGLVALGTMAAVSKRKPLGQSQVS